MLSSVLKKKKKSSFKNFNLIKYFLKVISTSSAFANLITLQYYLKYQCNTELSSCVFLISENMTSDVEQSWFQTLANNDYL